MSNDGNTAPDYTYREPYPAPAHAAKPKRSKGLLFGLAGVVALVLGCCGGATLLTLGSDAPDGNKTVATAPASGAAGAASPVPLPTKGKYYTPVPQDFTLSVKVLEKQCFGSAGCNLQYRISKVTYTGQKMDPGKTYEISYKVTGLDDAKEGTFVLTGGGDYTVQELEFGQTSSSGKTPKAVVTAIELL